MAFDNIFAGANGFLWFFGTVEDNSDDLGLGRVRVRIIGHHNQDQTELPTYALPYATVIRSVDNPVIGGIGTTVKLHVGTRVIGFFLDGESRNQPAVFGVLSGEHVTYTANEIPIGSTPQQPNTFVGVAPTNCETETSCPSGVAETSTSVNAVKPDVRFTTIDKSNFVYPMTGYVRDAYGTRQGRHKGVDIAPLGRQTSAGSPHLGGRYKGKTGSQVFAVADGTVMHIFKKTQGQRGVPSQYDKTGHGSRSFGNAIVIRHEIQGLVFLSIYAHLGTNQDAGLDTDASGVLVSVGQRVVKGQQIGTCGRTHCRDGETHIHFEMRIGESLAKGANNTIPPSTIFPKMANIDTSILSWVRATLKWDALPYLNDSKLPMQALETPR